MDDIKKPVFLWIDQICINQEDPNERSDQVGIMDKIYKRANMVLIWLGCDPTMVEAARRLQDWEDHDAWAIGTLIAHPYFSRIWIIQEIVLNVKYPITVCGGIELNWDHIRFASQSTYQSSRAATWATNYRYNRRRERRTLEDCIFSHCESDCHDTRDKVYGLLGLTPERWRVRVDYTKEVLEVYFDAVAALCEELFDLNDPECLYPERLASMVPPQAYCKTLIKLGSSMGFTGRHLVGLKPFLEYTQAVYLGTEIRNVQHTYMGRIFTRVQVKLSSEQTVMPEEGEEEEIEVSWGSITATRRNPLMRDIIPEMGLQLASTTTGSLAEQGDDLVPVPDRWWCKHEGKIHYFDNL